MNPTPLGQPFRAGFRHTWVPKGTPEEHEVPWVFVSPSGAAHEVMAEYLGDFVWEVEFVPEEIGRWMYQWQHDLVGTRYQSPVDTFDVVVESREAGIAALERLTERIRSSELEPGRGRVEVFGPAFNRLERGILPFETPETFPMRAETTGSEHLGDLFDAARDAMSGARTLGPRHPLELPGN